MKIAFGNGVQNGSLSVYRLNQNAAAQTRGSGFKRTEVDANGDAVSISRQGRTKSLLEGLILQKMEIDEKKKSLIARTLEKGETLDTINAQLQTYDEQIKNIDARIAETMAGEAEKQAEKTKPKMDAEPTSKEEAQSERLASISNLSDSLKQAEIAVSEKTKTEGASRALKKEIESDLFYASLSEGALKPKVDIKEAELADMEQKSFRIFKPLLKLKP